MLPPLRISIAILLLQCSSVLILPPAAADTLVFQTGRVTDVEELDTGRSERSDQACGPLQARIYTVETGTQILKMLGNMGPNVSPGERTSIRFAIDKKNRAHLFDPNGREHPVTLIVYESAWIDHAKFHPAVPEKQKSHAWKKAEVKKVEPLLVRVPVPAYGFAYRAACSVSRPVGWIYVLDVGGLTYEAVWRKDTPLDLPAKTETSIAWKGTDRIYLLEQNGKERTLAVRERAAFRAADSYPAHADAPRSKQIR